MVKVKAGEFEFGSLTRHKMEPVETALGAIGSKYQQVLSRSMLSAAQRQQQVVQRLKDTDKAAASAAAQLHQAPDFSGEEQAAQRLRQAVSGARRSLDAVVGSLYSIDRQLPENDRLLASGQTNKNQYPLLSGLMEERMVLRPEQLSTAACVVGVKVGQVGQVDSGTEQQAPDNGTVNGTLSTRGSASDSLRRFKRN